MKYLFYGLNILFLKEGGYIFELFIKYIYVRLVINLSWKCVFNRWVYIFRYKVLYMDLVYIYIVISCVSFFFILFS